MVLSRQHFPDIVNMDNYQVCWTCQGLLAHNKSTLEKIDNHIKKCSGIFSPGSLLSLRYYVCDQQDFYALKQIKKYLTIESAKILKRKKKDLLVIGFPNELIDSLLTLSGNNQTEEKHTFAEGGESFREDFAFQGIQNDASILSRKNEKETSCTFDTRVSVSENGVGKINIHSENQSLLTQEEKETLDKQCVNSQNENLTEQICKLCSYRTSKPRLMLRHLGSHDNGKSFVCATCNFSTLLRSIWNRHQCRKLEKNISCEICSEIFQGRVALNHHIVTHHTDTIKGSPAKVFKCKECSYVGRNMTSLSEHERKHTGEYLFCDRPDCTFKTPYKRSLQQHLQQKHAPEKDQVCHVCGFQTKHVTSLRKHMKLHVETKQFVCSQCSFSSYSSSDVVRHVQRKHLKEKKYSCSQCSFQTGYPMALKKHIARHEQKRNENVIGNQSRKARKVKQYSCSFCHEIFKTATKLKKHMGQCSQSTLQDATNLKGDHDNACDVFDEREICFDSQLDVDMSAEVYSITSNMLSAGDGGKNTFTAIVEDSLGVASQLTQERYDKKETDSVTTCKGRNPMLAETTQTLAAERDSPLLEESLFNLMSDFPRPPTFNRCHSASTLMFASLSPHLVDRPLTPDFFSDNPASSFFQSLSRNLEQDHLTVGSLN